MCVGDFVSFACAIGCSVLLPMFVAKTIKYTHEVELSETLSLLCKNFQRKLKAFLCETF